MIEKTVYVSRVRDFLHEIARLNKKAARIGVAAIQFEDLGIVTQERTVVTKDEDGNEDSRTYPVDVNKFRLTLPEPADCQWEPIAKITPTDEGGFAEAMPAGTQADADRAKSLDPQNCDHCHTRRDRSISYVVRHKTDKRVLQLGRNCFEDYVGKDTLRALEFQAVIMASIGGDEDGYWGEGGAWKGPVSTVAVRDCVAFAEYMFRTRGWQYNVKNEYSGEIEVEGTHRFVRTMIKQVAQGDPSNTAKEIQAGLTEADWAATDAAIERMSEIETTDEFGATLQNLAQYQWVPEKKAALAAYIGQFLRQIDRRAREAQLNAKRVYVGTVGQREVFADLTCVRCPSFDTDFGVCYVNTFEDADGNVLIWKTGSISFEVGYKLALQGTVKDHSEYNGTKQTILTRCKELDAEALAKAQAKAARAAAKARKQELVEKDLRRRAAEVAQ